MGSIGFIGPGTSGGLGGPIGILSSGVGKSITGGRIGGFGGAIGKLSSGVGRSTAGGWGATIGGFGGNIGTGIIGGFGGNTGAGINGGFGGAIGKLSSGVGKLGGTNGGDGGNIGGLTAFEQVTLEKSSERKSPGQFVHSKHVNCAYPGIQFKIFENFITPYPFKLIQL